MKSFLRKIIPPKQRQQIRSILEILCRSFDQSAGFLVNILPAALRIFLKSHLKVIRKMDYSEGDIFLDVSSSMEYRVRLYSCRREPETVNWIETFFEEKDVFYDIGANVGAYS